MPSSQWPQWVWVGLTAEDMEINYFAEWVYRCFENRDAAESFMNKAQRIAGVKDRFSLWYWLKKQSYQQRADLWNDTMVALGYTEIVK